MGNLTTNFDIQEFVSRSTYQKWGANSTWFLVREQVEAMQWLRTRTGVRLVVNNWHTKNPVHFWRGLRTPDAPSFNPWSQHSYKMNATDFDSPDMTVEELYKWLLDNQEEVIAKTSIRAVEDISATPRWLHADSRWVPNAKGLLIVKP
jgi:hypothetical protein